MALERTSLVDTARRAVAAVKRGVAAARRRSRLVDHVMATLKHYGNVQGSMLAGAVTYFGFLSFFPLLALAFAVVGYVARWFPSVEDNLVTAIQQVFPGIVTLHGQHGTISMQQVKGASNVAGLVGLLGLLYSGLGWVSGLRQGLETVFLVPSGRKPNFFKGKAVDLAGLVVIGLVLVVSVGISGALKGLAGRLIGWLGLGDSWVGTPLVWTLGFLLGLAASTLLFFVMYRLLGDPDVPRAALVQGALLGAVGFELLKLLVVNVLGAVGGSSFAPLAIAVTLVVWINYFSRLVMYGAAWAVTAGSSAAELALRAARRTEAEKAKELGVGPEAPASAPVEREPSPPT